MIGFDPEAQQQLAPYLEPGEKLLWSGRPRRGLMLRPSDVFAIPGSLAWLAFAVYWEQLALERSTPVIFAIFGLAFVAMGVHGVIGRFFSDAWLRARTVYGLTDRRAVIRSGLLKQRLTSVFLANLADTSLTGRAGGEGTIVLGRPVPMVRWGDGDMPPPPSFEAIPDAARVYQLIQKTKGELLRTGSK